jgi:hypothetical protein
MKIEAFSRFKVSEKREKRGRRGGSRFGIQVQRFRV